MKDSSSSDDRRRRREVHYQGRVQGVGFRYTAQAAAQRYDVTGYVENLPDGRVHLVAEGTAEELDALLADIARELAGYIRSVAVDETDARGGFDGFRIKIY